MTPVPFFVFWRMPTSGIVLTTILKPRELVVTALARDAPGCTSNKAVCRQQVPFGAEAWSGDGQTWQSIETFPLEWFK